MKSILAATVSITPKMGEMNPAITDLEDRILDAIEGWDIVAISGHRFEIRWASNPTDIPVETEAAVAALSGPESSDTRSHRLLRWGGAMSLEEVRRRLEAGER